MESKRNDTSRLGNLEKEFERALRVLQKELTDNRSLYNGLPSSVQVPKNGQYFQDERKMTIQKMLRIEERNQFTSRTKMMKEEMEACRYDQYTKESLPFILHQFFVDRVEELVMYKHTLMSRWKCYHSNTENEEEVYKTYHKLLCNVMAEIKDCIWRAERLSVTRDCYHSKCQPHFSLVKDDDVVIYIRWLVDHQFSVKHVRYFLKDLEWLPLLDLEKSFAEDDFSSDTEKHSLYSVYNHLTKQKSDKNKNIKPARDSDKLYIPLLITDLDAYKDVFDKLLENYQVSMRCDDIKSRVNEIELFHLVIQKFKSIHALQEEKRKYPVYGSVPNKTGLLVIFKKNSDWLEKADTNIRVEPLRISFMQRLKDEMRKDEMLTLFSSFLSLSSSDQVLKILKSHSKTAGEDKLKGVSNVYKTKELWDKIFTLKQRSDKPSTNGEFETHLSIEANKGSFLTHNEINKKVSNKQVVFTPSVSHGAYLSYVMLRHLKINEDRQTCVNFLNYFRSIERTLTLNHAPETSRKTYMYNNPIEECKERTKHLNYESLLNDRDTYSVVEGMIIVKDAADVAIVYDVALEDFKALNEEMFLVASHYMHRSVLGSELNGTEFDRFTIMYDFWSCECLFLERKKHLVDLYMNILDNTMNAEERHKLSKLVIGLLKRRPRFDFNASYFTFVYKHETEHLQATYQLISTVMDHHIKEQKGYLSKIKHSGMHSFGLPLFPPNDGESKGLLDIYPYLYQVTTIIAYVEMCLEELVQLNPSWTTCKQVRAEGCLCRHVEKIFLQQHFRFSKYCRDNQENLFAGIFIDNPQAVSECILNTVNEKCSHVARSEIFKRKLEYWCVFLEALSTRHILQLCLVETDILEERYKQHLRFLNFPLSHAFVRPESFEFAQLKMIRGERPCTTQQFLECDGNKLDSYIPTYATLSINDLDDTFTSFSFKDPIAFVCFLRGNNLNKLKLSLQVQTLHKHLLTEAHNLFTGARIAHRNDSNLPSMLQSAILSLQLEKVFYRDKMLNEYVRAKEKQQIKTVKDAFILQSAMIEKLCNCLHERLFQHATRAHIFSYRNSFVALLEKFPNLMEIKFTVGAIVEEEGVPRLKTKSTNDQLMSANGDALVNLWYIPTCDEILHAYEQLRDEERVVNLTTMLRILSSLHDICQFLCAHARSGDEYAMSANWSGYDGIVEELNETEKEISGIEKPIDPLRVAEYLELKRDVMYMRYVVVMKYSVMHSFLEKGKDEVAQLFGASVKTAFQKLTTHASSIVLNHWKIPQPFEDEPDVVMFARRMFNERHGYRSGSYFPLYNIANYMQLSMRELSKEDKRVVNGEMLETSLLLLEISRKYRDKDIPSEVLETLSKHSTIFSESVVKNGPMSGLKAAYGYLLLWLLVENVKTMWSCRRLHVACVNRSKAYIEVQRAFDHEYAQPLCCVPMFEWNHKLLFGLLESIECFIIEECVQVICDKRNLATKERSRVDESLPVDLWQDVTSENVLTTRPQIVERFIESLGYSRDNENVTITRQHLEDCLRQLSSSCFAKEKETYLSYSSFYENSLRKLRGICEERSREVVQVRDNLHACLVSCSVEVDYSVASKCISLLQEITALRSKSEKFNLQLKNREELLTNRMREKYEGLIMDLFQCNLKMKGRYNALKSKMCVDVHEKLNEVRDFAFGRFKEFNDVDEVRSRGRVKLLQKFTKERESNTKLLQRMGKYKMLLRWQRMASTSLVKRINTENKVLCETAAQKYLDQKLAFEEKEKWMEQELMAMKKTMFELQKKSSLPSTAAAAAAGGGGDKKDKSICLESSARLSSSQDKYLFELLKEAEVKKLSQALEEKERELKALKESHHSRNSMNGNTHAKKLLKRTMEEVQNERRLKEEAFHRVSELQEKVNQLEIKLLSVQSNDYSNHSHCIPLVTNSVRKYQNLLFVNKPKSHVKSERPQTAFTNRPSVRRDDSGSPTKDVSSKEI